MAAKKTSKSTKVSKVSKEIGNALLDHFKSNSKIHCNISDTNEFFSTGNKYIDTALGGGICMRKITLLAGRPGSGKTTFGYNIMGAFQRNFNNKCIVLYIDNEQSANNTRLRICGLDYENEETQFIKVTGTLEDVFKAIDLCISFKESDSKYSEYPILVIWDSITSTSTEKGMEVEDHNKTMGLNANILSHILPKYINKHFITHNVTMVAISQLRDKIDAGYIKQASDLKFMGGSNKRIPGGNALWHATGALLLFEEKDIMKEEEYGFSAIIVRIKAVKNKYFTPNIPISVTMKHVTGFSDVWTNYLLMKESKYLEAKGRYWEMKNYFELDKEGNPTETKKKFERKKLEYLYNTDTHFREVYDSNAIELISLFEKKHNVSMEDLEELNKCIEESHESDISEDSDDDKI